MTLVERGGASPRLNVRSKLSRPIVGALAAALALGPGIASAQLPTKRPLGVESPSQAASFRVEHGYSMWDPNASDSPANAKMRAHLRWVFDHNFGKVLKNDGPKPLAADNMEGAYLASDSGSIPPSGSFIVTTRPIPLRNQPSENSSDKTFIDRGYILTSDGKLQGKFLQVGIVDKDGVRMGFVVPQAVEPW